MFRKFSVSFALCFAVSTFTAVDAHAASCETLGDYTPICIGSALTFPSLPDGSNANEGGGAIDPNNDYGSVSDARNPTWFYFKTSTAGTLVINESNSGFIDIDGVLWGPFDSLGDMTSACDNTGTFTSFDSSLDSDYTSASTFSFSTSVVANKFYVLLVTNFDGVATDITLADGGSTATTDCSATCGNGVLEPGEVCDDGGTAIGDGCGATCFLEAGESCLADPQCQSDSCSGTNVCNSVCGDGFKEGLEVCDDGDTDGGDGCAADCSYVDDVANGGSCGVNAACVSGFCDSGTCACDGNADCAGGEVCDTSEAPNACETANTCGNGTVEGSEVCDDGDTDGGDGCSSGCLVENGGACTGNGDCVNTCIGSTCSGAVANGETCDTGDDDDCTSSICESTTCEPCEDDQSNPTTDNGCSGGTSFCLTSGGAGAFECVECLSTSDCGINNFCNASSACVGGCVDDGDCGGAIPACDLSDGSSGTCEVCVNDASVVAEDNGCDASGGTPICAVSSSAEAADDAGGSECRTCIDDSAGRAGDLGCDGATPFCDTVSTGTCMVCVDDSNCPGVQVCTTDPVCAYPDSDMDGTPDDIDTDDDNDGVPDSVEGAGTDYSEDADMDGVPDYVDPDAVTCDDDDDDGFCDFLPEVVDFDGDGLPNHLDADADGDGIPDATEAHDADGDGLADAVAVNNDDDGDGLDDAFDADCAGMPAGCLADGMAAPTQDSDGDMSADYLDADSDNDGRLDRQEAFDGDGDGEPDVLPSGVDADGDGLDDAFDEDQMGVGPTGQDADDDGRPDYVDLDSDGDGIADNVECPDPTNCTDSDGDGVADVLDEDSDNDGVVDAIEGHDGDGDGMPDFPPLGVDEDNDGLDDAYDGDMAGGVVATLPDLDGNGVPDYLEETTLCVGCGFGGLGGGLGCGITVVSAPQGSAAWFFVTFMTLGLVGWRRRKR